MSSLMTYAVYWYVRSKVKSRPATYKTVIDESTELWPPSRGCDLHARATYNRVYTVLTINYCVTFLIQHWSSWVGLDYCLLNIYLSGICLFLKKDNIHNNFKWANYLCSFCDIDQHCSEWFKYNKDGNMPWIRVITWNSIHMLL